MEGFEIVVALQWLIRFLISGILMFFTVSPYAFLAEKTKGIVAPMIAAAVMIMGSAALCNQEIGAIYPWVSTYFLIKGKLMETGYPVWLSIFLIFIVTAVGYYATFKYFVKEDLK